MSDEEWALIADLVEPYSSRGQMGRPVKSDRRAVVDAIFGFAEYQDKTTRVIPVVELRRVA